MINKIILASRSGVRKKILEKNSVDCEVVPANVDEDQAKESLLIFSFDTCDNWLGSPTTAALFDLYIIGIADCCFIIFTILLYIFK